MAEEFTKDVSELEVYMAFFGYVQRHMKVMTLAYVVGKVGDDNIVSVKPFPIGEKETEKIVRVYCLSSSDKALINDSEKSLCLVGFTDRKFSDNYRIYKNTDRKDVYNDNSEMHSDMNGIILRVFD